MIIATTIAVITIIPNTRTGNFSPPLEWKKPRLKIAAFYRAPPLETIGPVNPGQRSVFAHRLECFIQPVGNRPPVLFAGKNQITTGRLGRRSADLDLIDSICFTAPVLYFYLLWVRPAIA